MRCTGGAQHSVALFPHSLQAPPAPGFAVQSRPPPLAPSHPRPPSPLSKHSPPPGGESPPCSASRHVYDAQSQPLQVTFDPRLWQPYSQAQRYTQDDARQIISYAFARGIRVLPEFEMPGHTAIFAKADPNLVACDGYVPWDGLGWPTGVMCMQPPW